MVDYEYVDGCFTRSILIVNNCENRTTKKLAMQAQLMVSEF